MKIITWNCQGAFRKKAEFILPLRPDILVVQECEERDKLVFNLTVQRPNDILWFGDNNKHKGLGVFAYNDYRLQLIEPHNKEIKIISPISVTGGQLDFTLFAIWANNHNDPDGQYVEQVWKAVNHYDHLLNNGRTILTGDFNSNTIWDREHKIGSHSAVVKRLAGKNIYSVYHKRLKQEQGKESHPTFFFQKNKNKPYHLDYVFASADLIDKIDSFEIGAYDNWIAHSDHAPLTTTFKL